jgi:hypothetical protein
MNNETPIILLATLRKWAAAFFPFSFSSRIRDILVAPCALALIATLAAAETDRFCVALHVFTTITYLCAVSAVSLRVTRDRSLIRCFFFFVDSMVSIAQRRLMCLSRPTRFEMFVFTAPIFRKARIQIRICVYIALIASTILRALKIKVLKQ